MEKHGVWSALRTVFLSQVGDMEEGFLEEELSMLMAEGLSM